MSNWDVSDGVSGWMTWTILAARTALPQPRLELIQSHVDTAIVLVILAMR